MCARFLQQLWPKGLGLDRAPYALSAAEKLPLHVPSPRPLHRCKDDRHARRRWLPAVHTGLAAGRIREGPGAGGARGRHGPLADTGGLIVWIEGLLRAYIEGLIGGLIEGLYCLTEGLSPNYLGGLWVALVSSPRLSVEGAMCGDFVPYVSDTFVFL